MVRYFGSHGRWACGVVIAMAVALLIDVVFLVTRWAPGLLNPEGEFRPYRGDWMIPVVISISLSAVAGYAWSQLRSRFSGRARDAATYLTGLFVLMAVDDFLAIHEKIERFTGVDWLFIYLPLMSIGAVAGGYLVILTQHLAGSAPFRRLAVGGAACWGLAQVLEGIAAFWDDAYLYAVELSVPEEALETVGSGLFALSAWALCVAISRRGENIDAGVLRPAGPQ